MAEKKINLTRCNEARSCGNAKEPKKWCGICSKHKAFRMYVCPDCIVEGRKLLQKENAALKKEVEMARGEQNIAHKRAISYLARAEKAEAELDEYKTTLGAERKDYEAIKAKLAEIEKDLRERIAKYASGAGKGGLYSIILKELNELLDKHFPNKPKHFAGIAEGKGFISERKEGADSLPKHFCGIAERPSKKEEK